MAASGGSKKKGSRDYDYSDESVVFETREWGAPGGARGRRPGRAMG